MGKNTVEEVIIFSIGEKMRIKDKLTLYTYIYIYTWKEAKKRLRGHRGIITHPGQENIWAPLGVAFRAPGHSYADVSFIPI